MKRTALRRKKALRRGKTRKRGIPTKAMVMMVAKRTFRESVLVRDHGCCQMGACGTGPYVLEVHHVYPQGKYPDLRLLPENGLTLCRGCHRAWHRSSRAWRVWWSERWPDRAAALAARVRAR